MAHCPQKNCNWYGKAKGVKVHLAKVHHIHPQHDSEPSTISTQLEHESNGLELSSKCPVPFCKLNYVDLRDHLEGAHPEWRLSNGRFVFEVV